MVFSELINVLKLKQLVLDANLHEDFRIADIQQIKKLNEATEDDCLYYFAKNADLKKILSSAEEKTQLQNAILPIDAVKMAPEIALNYMLTDDKHLSTLVDEVKNLLKKSRIAIFSLITRFPTPLFQCAIWRMSSKRFSREAVVRFWR